MDFETVSYNYEKSIANPEHSSESTVFGLLFMVAVFFAGIIFIPMYLNDYWMIAFIATIIIVTVIRSHVVTKSVDREFFDNPDNHSHDDECETCGEIYGPKHISAHPHIRRSAYICRHASGQMDYPR